jgi:hypothetical protein
MSQIPNANAAPECEFFLGIEDIEWAGHQLRRLSGRLDASDCQEKWWSDDPETEVVGREHSGEATGVFMGLYKIIIYI